MPRSRQLLNQRTVALAPSKAIASHQHCSRTQQQATDSSATETATLQVPRREQLSIRISAIVNVELTKNFRVTQTTISIVVTTDENQEAVIIIYSLNPKRGLPLRRFFSWKTRRSFPSILSMVYGSDRRCVSNVLSVKVSGTRKVKQKGRRVTL